jgi:putative OPT family oligopeptide transporter
MLDGLAMAAYACDAPPSATHLNTPFNSEPRLTSAPPLKPPAVHELTVRSMVVGLAVAAVIGASYPYIVLKFGFGPNISVVSAFFGFLALGLFSRDYNRWENNIVQTAGTTAGQIAFVCWLLAAFDMLANERGSTFHVHLTALQTFLWLTTAGLLGVLLAVPLRQHFIVDEQLAFPDGVAAGETLILLDSKGEQARRSAYAMIAALFTSGLLMFATSRAWIIDLFRVTFNRFSRVSGVGVGVSLLSIGTGMIIGIRICTSMLVGMAVSWIVAPALLGNAGIIGSGAKKADILLWVMWPATGLLVAGGLTALGLKWRVLVRTFQSLRGASVDTGDFPMRWNVIGCAVTATALILVQRIMLGTPVWQSVVAIVLAVPLMLVALRVLGETNWGPISTMTNVMQALFGAIAPGDLNAGMVSSGITASVAAESEGLMQDYKTGYMIGSTPRVLTYMQLIAVPVGALALALIYPLLRDTYGIGEGGQLSSPTSVRWVGFAKILSQGFSHLPPGALIALLVGATLGIIFTVLEQNKSWRTFIPSPTGVGIGMLIPASAVTTIFIGGLIEWIWRRTNRISADRYAIPVASGFIAGDALVAVILPILYVIGILKPV